MLLSNRKEWITDSHNNMYESYMHFAKLKRPDPQSYVLYDSFHMTLWKRQNDGEKKRPVAARGC